MTTDGESCPNCGAPAAPSDDTCGRCGFSLAALGGGGALGGFTDAPTPAPPPPGDAAGGSLGGFVDSEPTDLGAPSGGGSLGGFTDAGPPLADPDPGPATFDSGPPLVDDGPPLVDPGPPLADPGPPLVDSGPPLADSGPPLAGGGGPPLADGSGGDAGGFQAASMGELFGQDSSKPQAAAGPDKKFSTQQLVLMGVGGFILFVLVLVGIDSLSSSDPDVGPEEAPQAGPTEIPPSVPYSVPSESAVGFVLEDPVVDASKWDPAVADLVPFVEEARGLRFQESVEIRFVPGSEFIEEQEVDPELEDPFFDEYLRVLVAQYRSLGLLEGDLDLRAQLDQQASESGVLGDYRPTLDVIRIRNDIGSPDGPLQRSVIVHELVHALDDQAVDLSEFHRSFFDTTMLLLMVEGNASRIEHAYIESLSAEDRELYETELAALESRYTDAGLLQVLGVETQVVYDGGAEVVSLVDVLDDREAIDTLLAFPPDRSAELLSVSTLFLHGGEPWAGSSQEATYPGLQDRGEEVWDFGSLGAWLWYIAFASHMDQQQALDSADVIESDGYVVYEEPDGRICGDYEIVARSEAALGILHRGVTLWASALPEATVDNDFSDLAINVTACDPGPGASANFVNQPTEVVDVPISRINQVTEVLEVQSGWWAVESLLERERWCLAESVQRAVTAEEALAGLSDERVAELGQAAVISCLPDRGEFGLGPYEGACSAASLAPEDDEAPVLELDAALPEAVQEKAQAIARAAVECDFTELAALLSGNAPYLYDEAGVEPLSHTDFSRSWTSKEGRGVRVLSSLVSTLGSGWMCGDEVAAVVEGHEGGGCAFMWAGDSPVDAEGFVTVIDSEGNWLGFGEAIGTQVSLFELWSRVRVGRANTFEYSWSGASEGAVLPAGWPSLVPPGASLLLD